MGSGNGIAVKREVGAKKKQNHLRKGAKEKEVKDKKIVILTD